MMRLQVLAFLTLTLCLFNAGDTQAAEAVLRLSVQQAASEPIGQNILSFKREVEAKTNGTVKIEIAGNGQIIPDHLVPEAVSKGSIEMGGAPLAQYAAKSLAASMFLQPFLFNFDAIVRVAADPSSEIRRAVDAELLKQSGVHVLWWQPAGWNAIFSKGPMANPDAMNNRNIRVYGDVAAEFVTLCGGTPHSIPDSSQKEALEANLVDASIGSISAVKDYELWRKMDTLTNVRYSENIQMIIINANSWKSLTPDQQKAVTEAARKAEKEIWEKHPSVQADIYAYAAAKGMKVQDLTADDTVAWRICSSSILEQFMARSGAQGAKLLAAYGKLRANPAVLAATR
jgi:C4-dicarboxylate-binding protein DctP